MISYFLLSIYSEICCDSYEAAIKESPSEIEVRWSSSGRIVRHSSFDGSVVRKPSHKRTIVKQ